MQGDDFCSNPFLITQTLAFEVILKTSNAFFKKGCAFQTVLTEEKLQKIEKHIENKKEPIALKIIKGTEKKRLSLYKTLEFKLHLNSQKTPLSIVITIGASSMAVNV